MTITPISSILKTAEHYDALLLDLWGVIHDGQKLYPGVRETIKDLRLSKKKIIFLSNAPRRAHKAAFVLANFGITEDMYDHVITSGEAMAGWLDKSETVELIGKNYFYIGPDKDLDVLDGLDYNRSGLSKSNWILNVGYQYDEQTIDELQSILKTAASMNKIMICANPDIEVVRQNGQRIGCAGEIAAAYEDAGGKVRFFGKPYSNVYELSLQRLENTKVEHVLAVGDSLHTDIKGANNANIDSVLVTGGILKSKIIDDNNNLNWNSLDKEISYNSNAKPDYIISSFGL